MSGGEAEGGRRREGWDFKSESAVFSGSRQPGDPCEFIEGQISKAVESRDRGCWRTAAGLATGAFPQILPGSPSRSIPLVSAQKRDISLLHLKTGFNPSASSPKDPEVLGKAPKPS